MSSAWKLSGGLCLGSWRLFVGNGEGGENEEEEVGLSALKKFTDVRWIENLRSSAWKLS